MSKFTIKVSRREEDWAQTSAPLLESAALQTDVDTPEFASAALQTNNPDTPEFALQTADTPEFARPHGGGIAPLAD